MASQKSLISDLPKEITECLKNKDVRIESLIGKGSFSNVYKAVSGDKRLAVKVIKLEDDSKEVQKPFLLEEMNIASTVKHEYIVKTHSVLELKNGFILIISDFADGGDLIDILDKNIELEERVIKRWFWQIVTAVEYLHSIGVSHRDIKPDNILIDNGVAKLTDFGFAHKSIDSEGNVILSTDICGSLEYLSPEEIKCIIDDEPYDPFISDSYSLGVLLFLMLDLNFPYDCTGIQQKDYILLERHLNKQMTQNWKLLGKYCKNENVISLLKRLLDPNVKTRMRCHQILTNLWIRTVVQNNDDLPIGLYS